MWAWILSAALLAPAQPIDAPVADTQPAPSTWSAFEERYLLECRAPVGISVEPVVRTVRGVKYRIEGSRVVREGAAPKRIVVGILSALKDVTPETRANVQRAVAAFKRARVDIVVANGDVALNEFDLEEAMKLLGQTGFPTFVLIGNSEGRGAFNRAFTLAEKEYPNLFNINWVRHVDLGVVDLVSLAGYYNRPFIHQKSGCHLAPEDVEETGRLVDQLNAKGRTVVVVSHAPPKSRGADAIDRAEQFGNVGDPEILKLIDERKIRFGLFGHILEAGGRASSDVRLGKPAKPKKKHPQLYVNAGAASAMPWQLLGGKTARGMAMIVTIEASGASYEVLRLRK
ncbi:MAG: metallophosphoesterase [Deltaproteobacteria bacterium]|nr:metallophosphoesterase [Deltaproteobacteria bacterium]